YSEALGDLPFLRFLWRPGGNRSSVAAAVRGSSPALALNSVNVRGGNRKNGAEKPALFVSTGRIHEQSHVKLSHYQNLMVLDKTTRPIRYPQLRVLHHSPQRSP